MSLMRKNFSIYILLTFILDVALSDVVVSIDDVLAGGYTEDIVVPVTIANPDNSVGGFQFDVVAVPTLVTLSGASPVVDDFSADYTVFEDGSGRVIFYSNNGGEISSGGDDVVLNLHYDGSDILSALVDLEAYDLTVSDGDGNIISGELVNGSITIGDVIILSASTDTGDAVSYTHLTLPTICSL